ncbi:MAG TPA: hypothetical protein VF228_17890 [Iamia sp.]
MNKFDFSRLGAEQFELLAQAVVKAVIGNGTITFGPGRDGAREATFEGTSENYPSSQSPWSGKWLFQAKYHDTVLVGQDGARSAVLADVRNELDKCVNKYQYDIDHYVLITNAALSAVYQTGTRDRVIAEVAELFPAVSNVHVWDYHELTQFLILHKAVREGFLEFVTPGDVLAELLTQVTGRKSRAAEVLRLYLASMFSRDGEAQLDQAGEVGDLPVRLEKIYIDTNARVFEPHRLPGSPAMEAAAEYFAERGLDLSDSHSVLAVALDEVWPRLMLIGGPGEGKSTLGQYLAQIHRATLLKKIRSLTGTLELLPAVARLPFRIPLKDLAHWLTESDEGQRSVESYIAAEIGVVTSREFSTEDVHQLLSNEPCLLILDGLDEVMEADARKHVLRSIDEFVGRCEDALQANVQLIATSRPTSYRGQFAVDRYLHLQLSELDDEQVMQYVEKWIVARDLEGAKSKRLRSTMQQCVSDAQISLLTKTPLQVTILVLIILSGGTPPRQKEALFNEYLDVIYKRERAKSPAIIKTEREVLLGLHKFIGYLLHCNAEGGRTIDSYLPQLEYEAAIARFLRLTDPFSSDESIAETVQTLAVEVKERLVLLVEARPGQWGFELRSIQEFFAAGHLVDTAADSAQRYARFRAVARSPHWRNVALFFAGRVGRQLSGEGAAILEVCREIDREGYDLVLRRGARLAVELATERAFGVNRGLQHSAIEYGLTSLTTPAIAPSASALLAGAVGLLPEVDRTDHVVPAALRLADGTAPELLGPVIRTIARATGHGRELGPLLERMAEGGSDLGRRALLLSIDIRADPQVVSSLRSKLEIDEAEVKAIAKAIATRMMRDPLDVARTIAGFLSNDPLIAELPAQLAIAARPAKRQLVLDAGTFAAKGATWVVQLVAMRDAMRVVEDLSDGHFEAGGSAGGSRADWPRMVRERLAEPLHPPETMAGPRDLFFGLPVTPVSTYLAAFYWAIFLSAGEPESEWEDLLVEFLRHCDGPAWPVVARILGRSSSSWMTILLAGANVGQPPTGPPMYAFLAGEREWAGRWKQVEQAVGSESADLALLGEYGLDAPVSQGTRRAIEEAFPNLADLNGLFAARPSMFQVDTRRSMPADIYVQIVASLLARVDRDLDGRMASSVWMSLYGLLRVEPSVVDAVVSEGCVELIETLVSLTDSEVRQGALIYALNLCVSPASPLGVLARHGTVPVSLRPLTDRLLVALGGSDGGVGMAAVAFADAGAIRSMDALLRYLAGKVANDGDAVARRGAAQLLGFSLGHLRGSDVMDVVEPSDAAKVRGLVISDDPVLRAGALSAISASSGSIFTATLLDSVIASSSVPEDSTQVLARAALGRFADGPDAAAKMRGAFEALQRWPAHTAGDQLIDLLTELDSRVPSVMLKDPAVLGLPAVPRGTAGG